MSMSCHSFQQELNDNVDFLGKGRAVDIMAYPTVYESSKSFQSPSYADCGQIYWLQVQESAHAVQASDLDSAQ